MKKKEAFPLHLLKSKRPGEWIRVRDFCLQIGVATGDLTPEVFATWLADPMACDAYAVILFYDDESKWSMAAHYHRARLLGDYQRFVQSAQSFLAPVDPEADFPIVAAIWQGFAHAYLAWCEPEMPADLGSLFPKTPGQFREAIGDAKTALWALMETERNSVLWGGRQKWMSARATQLVVHHDKLLVPPLVDALARELDGPPDRGDDCQLMCLLDVVSHVAACKPALFAEEAGKHPFLADRLAAAAVRQYTFPGRCAAVTLLGFLREPIRGDAALAIAATLQDVWYVQRGVLDTSERLITLTDDLRAVLVNNLTGESAIAAHVAARILVNYAAARATPPEVRQKILSQLATAAAHPNSEREVFQLDENTNSDRWCVHHLGRLRDLLYQGMLTVAGLS